MYVNAKAELVTLAPGLRPERRSAPLARGLELWCLAKLAIWRSQISALIQMTYCIQWTIPQLDKLLN